MIDTREIVCTDICCEFATTYTARAISKRLLRHLCDSQCLDFRHPARTEFQAAMIWDFILSFLVASSELSSTDNSTLYRLPKSVYPVSYDLLLLTNVTRGNFVYTGRVSIDLNVTEETKKVILHAEKLKILKEKTSLIDGERDIGIDDQSYDNETQFWTIELSETLKLRRHSLTLHFVGEVLDDLFGFYRSSYKADNQTRFQFFSFQLQKSVIMRCINVFLLMQMDWSDAVFAYFREKSIPLHGRAWIQSYISVTLGTL